MSFFGVNVNPFSTPVGQKIEQATDGGLPSENWALNMEICDIINETEDGPRDGIKAIKKRLTQAAGKNYTIVMYTLTVLETCVKNCGKRFHTLACAREFITELVKMIGPKNEPPTVVQEKVLSLIQTWADAFQNKPYTQGVVQVYQELKAKGMQFPMTDLDSMAPILTPERSVPETMSGINQHEQLDMCDGIVGNQQQIQSSPQLSSSSPIRLEEQQIKKLKSEIDVVQGNMRVLGEMLQFFTDNCKQGTTQPDDNDMELLHQLYSTCRSMQERIVELVGKLVDDELTAELLCINDELNNLFLRYSRYTKNKTATSASTILAQTIGQSSISNFDNNNTNFKRQEKSLIDLDEDDNDDDKIHQNKEQNVMDIQQKLGALGFYSGGAKSKVIEKEQPDNDEFDMFAQSRTATYETTKNSGSKYEDNLEDIDSGSLSSAIFNRATGAAAASDATNLLDISAPNPTRPTIPNQESEFNEMAAWLDNNATTKEPSDQESLTSSEFERFLAERAAAADALPTLPTVTASPSTTSSTTTGNIQRQINKDQDKSLFAL